MNDDKTATSVHRKWISLSQNDEVRTWAASLGCTEQELRKTVSLVGNSVSAVRDYLRKTK